MKAITCKPVIDSNRISLSKEVREILNVKRGDFIQFIEAGDGGVLLYKVDAPTAPA